MTNNFIDDWEDYEDAYIIPIHDHMIEDDVIFKGKYFLKNLIKFSGKMKFQSDKSGKFNERSDISLEQKFPSDSRYYFLHRSNGETSLDSKLFLFRLNNHLKFHLYNKFSITLNEKDKKGEFKLQLRTVHPNYILSLGIENFNPLECKHRNNHKNRACYPNLSIWSLIGQSLDKQSAYGGIGLSYNLVNLTVDNIKFLIGLNDKESRFKTNMEAIIANNPKEGKDEFCPLFKIYYDLLPCDNIRMLGDFYYDNSKPNQIKWNITNEFTIDNLTKLKTKINQNYLFTTTIIRRIGFFNFALTANINYIQAKEGNKQHLRYKFGALIEMNNL